MKPSNNEELLIANIYDEVKEEYKEHFTEDQWHKIAQAKYKEMQNKTSWQTGTRSLDFCLVLWDDNSINKFDFKLWDIQFIVHPHHLRIPHLLILTIVGVYA